MQILGEILDATRRRLPDLVVRADEVRTRAESTPPPPSFREALAAPGVSVIAEVKRRSPSRGELASDLDPVELAARYLDGGAAAVSVLTEPDYFSGSLGDLAAVAELAVPVLRKDFILHPAQIWEARAAGAAAVLLIVAALDDDELAALLAETAGAGLDALVEVHTPEEAERALSAGAWIVGVNNRDLGDFVVDLAIAEAIAPLLADAEIRVAESGIATPDDAARMAAAGYHAVLVGEALVRAPDPAGLVAALRGAR